MITLHTETVIDSCHYLNDYVGKCRNWHGHTFFVEVWIRGDINQCDEVGILYDFGNVKKIKDIMDHTVLNDIPYFKDNGLNPTAENITHWLLSDLKASRPELKFKIRVYETKVGKETWCEEGDWQ